MVPATMKLKGPCSLEEKLWPTWTAYWKAEILLCQQRSVKSYDFSSSHVWMWELDYKERWTPKNWCFWTVVLEKILRVPWTAKKSNQSILKEISPENWLGGLVLKLKLQYFGHLMWRTGLLEKTLMLEKTEGRRRRGQQRMSLLDGITNWMAMSLSRLLGDD